MSQLKELAESAILNWRRDAPELIAVDTETEGTAYFDRAFCVTASWRRPQPTMVTIGTGPGPKNVMLGSGVVVTYSTYKEMKQKAGEIEDHYLELVDEDYSEYAREMLLGSARWAFHNAKFDLQKLVLADIIRRHEFDEHRIEDTEALAHLDNPLRLKGLKPVSEELFGDTNEEEEAVKKWMSKNGVKLEEGYHLAPRELMIPYAKKDTNKTQRLWDYFEPRIRRYPELWALYEHEKQVTMVLLDMEARGMRLDMAYVDEQVKKFSREFIRVEREISTLVGKPVGKDVKAGEFNPGSAPQIAAYFQDKGHETRFKTKKGGPSYGKEFLKECDDPLAPLLKEYRWTSKMKNTYFLAMRNEQRDGILHPNFRQHGTKTGRFSSGEAEDE